MRRKMDRKLQLSRETLWHLTDRQLGEVMGAYETISPFNSCSDACCTQDCTATCRGC